MRLMHDYNIKVFLVLLYDNNFNYNKGVCYFMEIHKNNQI